MKKRKSGKNLMKLGILALFVASLLSGCVTPMGFSSSNTPVDQSMIEKRVGKTIGKDRVYSIFWINLRNPNLQKALSSSMEEKKADAVIDLYWYRRSYQFIVFGYDDYIVEGEAIQLKKETTR